MTDTPQVLRGAGAMLAVTAAIALLAACGTGRNAVGSGPVHSAATATRPAAQAGASGSQSLTTIDGTTVYVPSRKPSVLVFISISCADCSAAAKAVAQASQAVGDRATFLAVDLDPGVPVQALTSFLDYVHANDLPAMVDARAALLARYRVSALSSVIVIDPAGAVTYRAINPSSAAIVAAVQGAA